MVYGEDRAGGTSVVIDSPLVRKLIRLALEEDLSMGDVTSRLTIPEGTSAAAKIISREPLRVCGLPLIATIISLYDPELESTLVVEDGTEVGDMETLATLQGDARSLLAIERTLLNFLQRLSGIATNTAEITKQAGDLVILDTRKTTPGHRILEKYAVKTGGASNHRFHLGDMILVKNNHIDANSGDMRKTLEKIAEQKPPYMPLEIEVRTLEELQIAIEFSPESVMLDNMNDEEIGQAVAVLRELDSPPFIEASGGITEERFGSLKKLGVDGVSMSALTGRARTMDISMRIDLDS